MDIIYQSEYVLNENLSEQASLEAYSNLNRDTELPTQASLPISGGHPIYLSNFQQCCLKN